MNIVYLDQNFAICLGEKANSNGRYRDARNAVLDAVAAGRALFPYSEIHLAESAAMHADSRHKMGEFWDTVSGGYRFIEPKEIRSSQFKDILFGKVIRFRPHLVLYKEGRSRFAADIYTSEPESARARREQLRLVVEHWSSLKRDEIDGRIRRAEAATLPRLVMQLFERMLRGELPSLGQLNSEYVTISSELAWALRDLGRGDDTLFEAVAFMRDHALEVPAIAIECTGLESLAEHYALDNPRRSAVAKSQLDHDSNDLAVLSNFVPYCTAGTTDAKAADILRRAYAKLCKAPPAIFTLRQLVAFTAFVSQLSKPEKEIDPVAELSTSGRQSLLLVREVGNKLIARESYSSIGNIQREILPLGGLKVWSDAMMRWQPLFATLEAFDNELTHEGGGEATLYGCRVTANGQPIHFKVIVPFGSFAACRQEVEAAFRADLDEDR